MPAPLAALPALLLPPAGAATSGAANALTGLGMSIPIATALMEASADARRPGVTYDDGAGGVYTPEEGTPLLQSLSRALAWRPKSGPGSVLEDIARMPVGQDRATEAEIKAMDARRAQEENAPPSGTAGAVYARSQARPASDSLSARAQTLLGGAYRSELDKFTDMAMSAKRAAALQEVQDAMNLPKSEFAPRLAAYLDAEGKKKFEEKTGWNKWLDGMARGPAWTPGVDPFKGIREGMEAGRKEGKADFEKERDRQLTNFLRSVTLGQSDMLANVARQKGIDAAQLKGILTQAEDAGARASNLADSMKYGLDERKTRAEELKAKAAITNASKTKQTPVELHKDWVDYFKATTPGISDKDANAKAKEMMWKRPDYKYDEDAVKPVREEGEALIMLNVPPQHRAQERLNFRTLLATVPPAEAKAALIATIDQYQRGK